MKMSCAALLLVSSLVGFSHHDLKPKTTGVGNGQEGTWELYRGCGFPVLIALNSSPGPNYVPKRNIFLLIQAADFTEANLTRAFSELSAQNPEPVWLIITAFSDRQMLERMIKIYQSAGYVDFANTPEGDEGRRKLNDEVYPPKTGFFRAFYSRSGDGEESFQYSPNPAVAELAKVTLKENGNRNYNGDLRSDLILATKNGDVHKIRELLARGANVNWKDSQGETPLMQAADLSTVRLLLEEGANVDDKNNYGFTALIRASSLGLSSVVKALLEKGANVDSKNKYGNTALMSAAMKGYIEVVEILLGKGADPAATNNIGKTAMMFARERDYEEIVRRLKAAGADK